MVKSKGKIKNVNSKQKINYFLNIKFNCSIVVFILKFLLNIKYYVVNMYFGNKFSMARLRSLFSFVVEFWISVPMLHIKAWRHRYLSVISMLGTYMIGICFPKTVPWHCMHWSENLSYSALICIHTRWVVAAATTDWKFLTISIQFKVFLFTIIIHHNGLFNCILIFKECFSHRKFCEFFRQFFR